MRSAKTNKRHVAYPSNEYNHSLSACHSGRAVRPLAQRDDPESHVIRRKNERNGIPDRHRNNDNVVAACPE